MLLTRARNSASSKGTTPDGGGEAGIERWMTDEAGSKGLGAEAVLSSQDANDLFRTGGANTGVGASVVVDTGMDKVDKISLMSGFAHGSTISSRVVPSGG